jgi:hypothetical protein
MHALSTPGLFTDPTKPFNSIACVKTYCYTRARAYARTHARRSPGSSSTPQSPFLKHRTHARTHARTQHTHIQTNKQTMVWTGQQEPKRRAALRARRIHCAKGKNLSLSSSFPAPHFLNNYTYDMRKVPEKECRWWCTRRAWRCTC